MKYTAEEISRMMNLTELKERGWTNTLAAKFLPEPMLFKNPWCRATPIKKWWLADVEDVEKTEEFKILFEKAQRRRAIGKAAADKRRAQTMKQVEETIKDLKVFVFPPKVLLRKTIEAKEDWEFEHGNYDGVSDAPEHVVIRWEVNFIRHNLTNYDDILDSLFGMVGKSEAYELLKPAILDKIAESYPYLAEECQRQKHPDKLQFYF